jgi:UPF0755 protein
MKKLILLFFLFTIAVGIGFVLFVNELRPLNANKTLKRFVITKGESASQIGQDLAKNHIIKNALVFRIYSQVTQSAKKIKSGSYQLPSNLSVPEVIGKLLAGPTEVWVTIPEGLRREEISDKFGDFVNFKKQEFLQLTASKEGYLFPDTYLIPLDYSSSQIVKIMEDNFRKKFASVVKSKTTNLNESQVVNLASIIQREAITVEDMQNVSSTLQNRLNIGMPLGSDVTLEYALGYQKDEKSWWKKDLTIDDLALNSLYNTRLVPGLPPTPISNPGLVAIEAALNPPHTDYLYYLSDSDGKLHFAQTLEGHNANIVKYLQ